MSAAVYCCEIAQYTACVRCERSRMLLLMMVVEEEEEQEEKIGKQCPMTGDDDGTAGVPRPRE